MSPSVCSHVVLGKRHGPRLPPSPYRAPDYAPHSSLKCWKVLDHGPHGFPRIRDRDQNAFPHVLARPNIFSPEYWRDSEAQRFAEALLKGLEGGDLGIYIRKTLLRQMDAKRPRHGLPPPNPPFLKPRCALANVVQSRMLFGYCRSKSSA